MDANFLACVTGTAYFTSKTDDAVAARFMAIKHRLVQNPDDGDAFGYDYAGSRCDPTSLGWRFVQSYGDHDPQAIILGELDAEIIETWHAAANASAWYTRPGGKDWGEF